MAINPNSLTKFKSAITVVSADFVNSIYGGEYGSGSGDLLDTDDPRVIGHLHDGKKADGHAGKIDLVDHVSGQLKNINLGDKAVTKRTVFDTVSVGDAIPEWIMSGSTKKYLLDLRGIKSESAFQEETAPSSAASAIAENKLIRQRSQTWDGSAYADISGVWNGSGGFDLVFGSSSLEDLASGTDGDSRLLFDKSKSAFRVGSADHDQWDEARRGTGSMGLGVDVESSGDYSSISGGLENLVESKFSAICGGSKNTIKSGAESSIIIGGSDNLIDLTTEYSNSPSFSIVSGRGGQSFMWGQRTHSSGSYDAEDSVLTDFLLNETSPGEWSLLSNSVGTSQIFESVMFGHFTYSLTNIEASTIPYPTKTIAYLDGGIDGLSPRRTFFPRANCSYSIRIDATVSYTYWDGVTTSSTSHNSVSFTMSGGIVCRADGSFDYKMQKLTETFDSGVAVVPAIGSSGDRITNPAAPVGGGSSDFEVFFCHDEGAPTDAGASISSGNSMRIVLVNASDAVGPNNDLVGESITAKLTVVENMLNIFREPTV